MKEKNRLRYWNNIFMCTLFFLALGLHADDTGSKSLSQDIKTKVKELMENGKIPGLSLVVIKGNETVSIENFGYADLEKKVPVTPNTRFELASCSKAFTALAALQMEEKGLIHLDDPVSLYLPWFYVQYQGQKYEITIRQLLHHTSGIPWKTIALIPRDSSSAALEKTVKKILGIELNNVPGKQFEYATINYDIVGTVIQTVSRMTFEDYMAENVFKPLGLNNTTVGSIEKSQFNLMASGYKIEFFAPRKFQAPIFRGNNPAGYVISNATDMARWLKLQMGLIESDLVPLMRKAQKPDRTIFPNPQDFSSYAMGWKVFQIDGGEVVHSGLNPNFSSYIGFKPKKKIGVAVLSNLSSDYTAVIGNYILKTVAGEKNVKTDIIDNNFDKVFSVITFVLGGFLLLALLVLVSIILHILKRTRRFESLNKSKVFLLLAAILLCIPILIGIYLYPKALVGFFWKSLVVWSPVSLPAAAISCLVAIGAGFVIFLLSLLFPHKNRYINSMPFVVILSFIAGLANSAAIFILVQAFSRSIAFEYLLFYFGLAVGQYFFISTLVRTKLIKITNEVVYDFRLKLIKRMFSTRYQKFDKLDTGQIYTTVNNDTGRIGNSPNIIVSLINNIAIVLCISIYLLTISFMPTVLTYSGFLVIILIYLIFSKRFRVYMEEARDTQNVFMKLIDGMVRGFKELSLHSRRKFAYEKDLESTCSSFRQKRNIALIKFAVLSIFIEALLLAVLGFAAICIPVIFKDIQMFRLVSFVIILFYTAGPIGNIIGAVPEIVQIRVSWNRINHFLKAIPYENSLDHSHRASKEHKAGMNPMVKIIPKKTVVERLETKGLKFKYEQNHEHDHFSVGPIDLEVKKGEILFIIGGNGSGKTTLAKLLTGLYKPDKGEIIIDSNGDGKGLHVYSEQGGLGGLGQLGEFFSAVFSNYHLFKKLYDIDVSQKKEEIEKYLKLLELEGKVRLEDGLFSTIDLSGGQRKRLALLQCYLEDCPIYLFDEWAADQDPTFRKFFYRHLLPEMKKQGKIVIAITHDDNYFDVADKIIKMDMGHVKAFEINKEKYVERRNQILP